MTDLSCKAFACPKCGATPSEHGKGECKYRHSIGSSCGGFVRECDDGDNVPEDHGESLANPCHNAHCYHCGWEGTVPKAPRGLIDWERKALAAGWTMPAHRQAELDAKSIEEPVKRSKAKP